MMTHTGYTKPLVQATNGNGDNPAVTNCKEALELLGWAATHNPAALLAALMLFQKDQPKRYLRLMGAVVDYIYADIWPYLHQDSSRKASAK